MIQARISFHVLTAAHELAWNSSRSMFEWFPGFVLTAGRTTPHVIKWDRHTQEVGELVRGKQQLPNSASGRPGTSLGENGSALVIHRFLGESGLGLH